MVIQGMAISWLTVETARETTVRNLLSLRKNDYDAYLSNAANDGAAGFPLKLKRKRQLSFKIFINIFYSVVKFKVT